MIKEVPEEVFAALCYLIGYKKTGFGFYLAGITKIASDAVCG